MEPRLSFYVTWELSSASQRFLCAGMIRFGAAHPRKETGFVMLAQKAYRFLPMLVLFTLLAASCAPTAQPQTSETRPIPRTTARPLEASPITGQTPTTSADISGGSITRGSAIIDSISILTLESFPVQVRVIAKGNLPDGCTQIDEITQERQDSTFRVTISTSRPAAAACTQALVPFEESVNLDVRGLKAGTYTVSVNGVNDSFTLAVDNESPTTETTGIIGGSIAGRLWHDLCVSGRDGEPEPATVPAGCLKTDAGIIQANGVMEAGEPGINGVRVTLGAGACPATGLASAQTDANGSYQFDSLKPGTYCVTIDALDPVNTPVLLPGGWSYPGPTGTGGEANTTLTLASGGTATDINFGWDFQFLPPPGPQESSSPEPATADAELDKLKTALSGYQNPGDGLENVVAVARESVSSWLSAAPQPLTQATADTLVERLRAMLPENGFTAPVATAADVDGDGKLDLLLAMQNMYGFPALAFLGGDRYRTIALPVDYDQGTLRDFHVPAAWPDGVQAKDVTGDGRLEAVVTYRLPGGSADTTRVYTFRWMPDKKAFDLIFQATLVNWAVESTWELRPGLDGSQEFVLNGPAFSVFDHKLLPHPTRTQVWQWAPAAGRFIKAEETVSKPTTLRQQANAAEALLRQGEYEKAIAEYQKVIDDSALVEEDTGEQQPNWRAFARLRLGQTYALLGKGDEARTQLQGAITAGSTIGQLAAAFLAGYTDDDRIVAAWGMMMNKSDLHQLFYEEKAGNLGFPMTAFGVYYPGLAVAAYLDRHPEAATATGSNAFANLKAPGFNLKSVVIADVTGDGKNDVAFVTPDKDQEHAWLAYEKAGRWRVGILAEAEELTVDGALPLAQGGVLVRIRLPDNYSPNLVGYSWDDNGAVSYDLQGDTPTLRPRDPWPTLGSN
jgi:hypothetical protein